MLTECIILAGGLGTRLKSVSGETPKPLVEVSGKPFVYYIMDNLVEQGIEHIVFAVSYRSDFFIHEIGSTYKGARVSYSVETEPMGTGGAIKLALKHCQSRYVAVTNGDTYLDIDLQGFYQQHITGHNPLSMALVSVEDVSRYGSVILDGVHITGFSEKGLVGEGYINGGLYLLSAPEITLPDGAFSFEEKILKQNYESIDPFLCTGFFIDIGIPSDYFRACSKFEK